MSKLIKKGSKVTVIAGKDKGKSGEVIKVDRQRLKVVVENINVAVDFNKPVETADGSVQRQKVNKPMKLDLSNVKLAK